MHMGRVRERRGLADERRQRWRVGEARGFAEGGEVGSCGDSTSEERDGPVVVQREGVESRGGHGGDPGLVDGLAVGAAVRAAGEALAAPEADTNCEGQRGHGRCSSSRGLGRVRLRLPKARRSGATTDAARVTAPRPAVGRGVGAGAAQWLFENDRPGGPGARAEARLHRAGGAGDQPARPTAKASVEAAATGRSPWSAATSGPGDTVSR